MSVSTHMDHIGNELHQSRNHNTRLNDIACSHALGKAASCGDDRCAAALIFPPSTLGLLTPEVYALLAPFIRHARSFPSSKPYPPTPNPPPATSIKIHDLNDLNDVYAIITLDEERNMLDKLAWSADGQLLTVSTQSGTVHTYLTKLPTVGAKAENRLAYLSSLQEMTVMMDDRMPPVKSRIKLSAEPTTMAVGPFHAACAINNTAW